MEQFHENTLAESSLGRFVDQLSGDESTESAEFLSVETETEDEAPLHAEESPYTDDPVRVYLREMGAVRLLTKQGEVDLARRMERGRLRVRKVLSRSPRVQQMIMGLYHDVREESIELSHLVDIGGVDEAAKAKAHTDAMQRLTKVARLYRDVTAQEEKLEADSSSLPARPSSGEAERQAAAPASEIFTGHPRSSVFSGALGELLRGLSR